MNRHRRPPKSMAHTFCDVRHRPVLFELKGTPAEYKAGLDRAIENGWLVIHESGTYLRFTQAGADVFA